MKKRMELALLATGMYRVGAVHNSTAYNPGEEISKETVEELLEVNGWKIRIVNGVWQGPKYSDPELVKDTDPRKQPEQGNALCDSGVISRIREKNTKACGKLVGRGFCRRQKGHSGKCSGGETKA